jgi:hypothetical protein
MRRHRDRTWIVPGIVGALIGLGLLAALLSDGIGDVAGWLALSVPPAVVTWALRVTRRPRDAAGAGGSPPPAPAAHS